MTLQQVISQIQQIGTLHGFTIVIVGGAIVRLIGNKTTIKDLDEKSHTITLKDAENPGTTRPEDKKTLVDIDCIIFSNASDPFTKDVKEAFSHLLHDLKALKKTRPAFPAISLEPVLYHPFFSKPHTLTQFVSSIESYHDRDFFFRLGSVKQDVSRNSLQTWTYVFPDTKEEIVSLSPIALQKRYEVRGFSIKPKDKEKIWGKTSNFAKFVWEFTKKAKEDYQKDYYEWDEFARNVGNTTYIPMRIKKVLWNTYWATIGTYLAHGTGFVGKILLPLGNTLFAGK